MKYQERLTDDAQLLHCYLGQYRICLKRKHDLECRRREIELEFESPPSGAFRGSSLGLIDADIRQQEEKTAAMLTDIMLTIGHLKSNELERLIIEHRYIDGYNWDKICRMLHITRTPAVYRWRKGLYKLLEVEEVQRRLAEYKNREGEGKD